MAEMAIGAQYDDPRRLRELLDKAALLASQHAVTSVVVGMAGREGDLLFPELVDFVESALRMDDAIFRMTRERALLVLADVGREQAVEIVERLMDGFRERFGAAQDPEVSLGYFEVTPDTQGLSVKEVLPALFLSEAASH